MHGMERTVMVTNCHKISGQHGSKVTRSQCHSMRKLRTMYSRFGSYANSRMANRELAKIGCTNLSCSDSLFLESCRLLILENLRYFLNLYTAYGCFTRIPTNASMWFIEWETITFPQPSINWMNFCAIIASAMAADDPLNARQSNPGPGELVRACRRWKGLNSWSACCMSNPTPSSDDELAALIVLAFGELDPCVLSGRGELPRVPEQVLKHDPHQLTIPFGAQSIGDRELDLALGLGGLQLSRDLPCEVAQVDRLAAQLRARDAREPQQLFDHRPHPPRATTHPR